MSNFSFLEKDFPILAKLGGLAENYLYSDSNTCLFKLGVLGEEIVNEMFKYDSLVEPLGDNSQANKIRILKNEGLLPQEIDDILYVIRKARNKAAHQKYDSVDECKALLELTHKLCTWFMQVYGDWKYSPTGFKLPEDKKKDVLKRSNNAIKEMEYSEEETRVLIDSQLEKVGWDADSVRLKYSNGVRPEKGRNIAIAEWPTDSKILSSGKADYTLFVGLKLVGIIEAKKFGKDISSVIDNQCKDYAKNIKKEHECYQIGNFGGYKVPFLFAANGRKYLKQLETKSGVWFLDVRKNSNIPRALQGWISPQGIMEVLDRNTENAEESLKKMPFDLLRDEDGLNLRYYQIEAIEKIEEKIMEGKKEMLVSMATGTGKTRMILGLIYRLIKAKRFKRVLFLVDRNPLGTQASDVFKEVKIEELMTFDKIYNIKELGKKDIDLETKVNIATVQSMASLLFKADDKKKMPSVTDYDLIVVDEAHRGYILDREMGEDEVIYRNQEDYISVYCAVINYFDAVKIGITATPAQHTTQIFGKPIYSYSYREAVIDGYLVDHDAPHVIVTKLKKEGITFKKGEIVPVLDPVTFELKNSEELEDEILFKVESFNKKVITESFNRVVLEEIAKDIDPEGEGKTLIFAVDDAHADLVVNLLREIYEPEGIDNDAIKKLTGSIFGGNRDKILEEISKFKNERYPNVAVTVDLLTTGVDIPKIENLVFLRRIKSRILYEQMLGRATRLCPEINKDHFEIYDAVGIYEALEPVTNMKPVVVDPKTTFEDLLNGLETLDDEKKIENQIDMIIAKLQRKKRTVIEDKKELFEHLSGGLDIDSYIEKIRKAKPEEAKSILLEDKKLFDALKDFVYEDNDEKYVSLKEDEVLYHVRGYGEGEKPEDYIEEFNSFIKENMNKIAALNIICTRPKDLTKKDLKDLMIELHSHDFTAIQLNTAWKDAKNEDIAADIIGFIRQLILGSSLISHETRVKNAFIKLKKNHKFTKRQEDIISKIEKYLLNEQIIEKSDFEEGSFKTFGGITRIDKILENKLDNILDEINEYLYDDGGKIA
ncbi:MAG: type I restriction-modification system endonuclease [Oscillospiraceae bacterium]|nr:type I restriction-modification system endonuclease [Oscillospiraceae bacterium]